MILRCVIGYTTPDGRVFSAGELCSVEAELGLWLLSAAQGQFAVEEAQDIVSVQDEVPPRVGDDGRLDGPPADRAVARPPLGGVGLKSKKR